MPHPSPAGAPSLVDVKMPPSASGSSHQLKSVGVSGLKVTTLAVPSTNFSTPSSAYQLHQQLQQQHQLQQQQQQQMQLPRIRASFMKSYVGAEVDEVVQLLVGTASGASTPPSTTSFSRSVSAKSTRDCWWSEPSRVDTEDHPPHPHHHLHLRSFRRRPKSLKLLRLKTTMRTTPHHGLVERQQHIDDVLMQSVRNRSISTDSTQMLSTGGWGNRPRLASITPTAKYEIDAVKT